MRSNTFLLTSPWRVCGRVISPPLNTVSANHLQWQLLLRAGSLSVAMTTGAGGEEKWTQMKSIECLSSASNRDLGGGGLFAFLCINQPGMLPSCIIFGFFGSSFLWLFVLRDEAYIVLCLIHCVNFMWQRNEERKKNVMNKTISHIESCKEGSNKASVCLQHHDKQVMNISLI